MNVELETTPAPRRRWLALLPSVLMFVYFGWRLSPRSLPPFDDPGSQPVALGQDEILPEAKAILERVREVYASARTYRDQGAIRNERVEDGETELVSIGRFRVALERPDRLLWQWREVSRSRHQTREHVDLLQEGDALHFESRVWGELRPKDRPEALALIRAWDERDLLQLLFPREMGGRPLLERCGEPRLAGLERVGTHVCYRLEGRWELDGELLAENVLWIDRETHLLRRRFTRTFVSDWTSESTYVFAPDVEVVLAQGDLVLRAEY